MLNERNSSFAHIAMHLWLISSNDNVAIFTMSEIVSRFKISKSTFFNFLLTIKETQCPITVEGGAYKLKFIGNATKPRVIKEDNGAYLSFLKQYYASNQIEYPNLEKQGKAVTQIKNKIKNLMPKESTEEELLNNFKLFFNRIPKWWVENAFMLQSINKSFPKIYDQIKRSNGDKSIAGSVAKQTDGIDYSQFTKTS